MTDKERALWRFPTTLLLAELERRGERDKLIAFVCSLGYSVTPDAGPLPFDWPELDFTFTLHTQVGGTINDLDVVALPAEGRDEP